MAEKEWIMDSVIGFLRSPIWRIPVLTFIETKCLVFDTEEENKLAYTEVHKEYQAMVELLLLSFVEDIGIDSELFVEACREHTDTHAQSTLALLEQVQAAQDFDVFKRLMLRKNVELELQALQMIQKRNGIIPDVLKPGSETNVAYSASASADNDEEMLLQEVLRISKEEFEAQKKAKSKEINEDLDKAIANSKEDADRLTAEKQREEELLNQAILQSREIQVTSKQSEQEKPIKDQSMSKLVSGTSDMSLKEENKPSSSTATTSKGSSKGSASTVQSTPPIIQTPPAAPVSGAEAAANWLSSAKSESSGESQVQARASALASSSPAELQKREAYLKQQRDKLLALKKKERNKNLSTFTEEEAKSRPKSARAARQVTAGMDGNGGESVSKTKEEQDKTLAMRKALAERLKQEVQLTIKFKEVGWKITYKPDFRLVY